MYSRRVSYKNLDWSFLFAFVHFNDFENTLLDSWQRKKILKSNLNYWDNRASHEYSKCLTFDFIRNEWTYRVQLLQDLSSLKFFFLNRKFRERRKKPLGGETEDTIFLFAWDTRQIIHASTLDRSKLLNKSDSVTTICTRITWRMFSLRYKTRENFVTPSFHWVMKSFWEFRCVIMLSV